jgi:Ca2+-binding EF-hand superfamily protein
VIEKLPKGGTPASTECDHWGMTSEFQRDKVARVFAAMDADSDGYLTEGDFREGLPAGGFGRWR